MERKPCPWCRNVKKKSQKHKLEWTVIDDDFGQPVSFNLIHFCFACGRNLEDEADGAKE